MTVRINANSCKNALGTVFLLATAFFVCSTFISMRSVFADPVAPANAGIAQSGRQSPRSTSRTSDRTVSRSTTSRGSVAPTRTAVSRGTGATRSVSSRSITPTRPATSTRSVAVRGNRTNTQSTNRTVRARTGSTQSRISASGSVMSAGSRASVNTTYSYLNSRLNTGNYSNIIDSTTGLISADAYANCMDSYYACMDEICTARSTTKGRCSCAGRATNFLAAEEALERANEELIILSGQLSLLISTKGKGDDLAAAFSLTDAEKVMNCVSWRDTYAKYKSGTTQDDNGNDLMEQWYKNHPTYNDASATSALTTSYTSAPYYCTNNNFGFDIGDIDGSSSDILAQLKAWADAKDLAKEFATDNDTLLSNYNSTMSYVVNKFGGITMTDTSKADLDTMANKWGYKLFEYAHNNVCGRVLDSCFNGIYEACGTPVSVKDSDGNTHSKCQNGATTSCPFNYNSYISVNTDPNNKKYGEVELHERDSSNTNVTSTASCFGYTTTTTTSSAIRATSATSTNDPYYSLRGPVADARRSIMQKYLLDANSACDVYGANLKTTAQNINYQKVAAEQALQQKRLEFAQQERSDVFSNYKTATNNFTECQSELWDCYETYAEEDNWTTARIKSYCSQPSQVPHCYEVMVCTPGDTSLQAVIDKSDSTECTFSTDYKKNTCRNIVTISEILYGTSKAPESSDKENDILGALEGKTEVEKVSSAKIREKCLRNALKSENGTGEKTDKYSIRGWSLAVYKEKESTGTGTSADSGAAASELDSSATCTYTVTTCGTGYTRSTDSCTRNGTTYYKECIANTCDSGYNQTTTCTAGYDQETCQAGTTTKYKCTPKACTGFDKLASDTCPTGFHKSETTCLSGTTTKYKCVADVCDASAYQSAACGAGYDQETCLAGTTTMYKCTPKACTGFDKLASDTCPTGFHKSETTCLSGTTTKYKCIANTCDSGYNQTTTCTAGYDQETCQAGTTTMYKCTPKACTGFDKLASDTCPTGFHKSETTCLSGTTTKYKCIANTCDSSYNQTTTCAAGYDQETCQAGDTTMYKCTLCTFTTPVTDCNSSNGLVPSDRICTKNGVKYTDQCDYYSLNLGYMCNSNAQCFDGNRYSRVRSDDIDSNTNTPRSTSFCESGQYQGWKCNSVLGNYEWYLDPTKPFKEHIELINFVRYQARYLLTDMKDHQQHYCKMDGTPGGSSESELLLAICVPVISIDPI